MDFSFFTDGRALLFMTLAGIVYYFYSLGADKDYCNDCGQVEWLCICERA
jgi:hypothetical protein